MVSFRRGIGRPTTSTSAWPAAACDDQAPQCAENSHHAFGLSFFVQPQNSNGNPPSVTCISPSCPSGQGPQQNVTTGLYYCAACPAGSYQSATLATSCTPCPADTYFSSTGATACTPCPTGTGTGGTTGGTSTASCSFPGPTTTCSSATWRDAGLVNTSFAYFQATADNSPGTSNLCLTANGGSLYAGGGMCCASNTGTSTGVGSSYCTRSQPVQSFPLVSLNAAVTTNNTLLCLDTQGGALTSGTAVVLSACGNATALALSYTQYWNWLPSGSSGNFGLQHSASGLCAWGDASLAVTPALGAGLQLTTCPSSSGTSGIWSWGYGSSIGTLRVYGQSRYLMASNSTVPTLAALNTSSYAQRFAATCYTMPQPCGAGTWMNMSAVNVRQCVNCQAGMYSATLGAQSSATCLACGTGLSSTAGSSSCSLIAAGYYAPNATAVLPCPIGSYCPGGTAVGNTSVLNSYGIFVCAADTYASSTGAASCTACPAGTSTGGATGATSVAGCNVPAKLTSCQINTWSPQNLGIGSNTSFGAFPFGTDGGVNSYARNTLGCSSGIYAGSGFCCASNSGYTLGPSGSTTCDQGQNAQVRRGGAFHLRPGC